MCAVQWLLKSQGARCQTVLSCLGEHKGQTGQKEQKTDIFSIFSCNHEYLCLYIHLHVRIKTVNYTLFFLSLAVCACVYLYKELNIADKQDFMR